MITLRKTISTTAILALLFGAVATTPAMAWGYRNDNGMAVAGAVIGGMALGAAVGAIASQPSNYYGYGPRYGYPAPRPSPAYGYGGGYGYEDGYGYRRPHHHIDYDDYE